MEWIDFFSALHLGEHLYCHTDNLSKDLQGTKMAAVSGQRLANLTKGTLTKIRIDQSFDHFYANVARKSEGLLGEPTLPRKRHTPARLKVGAGTPSYPQTAKDHIVRAYYEAAIDNGDNYEAEFSFLKHNTGKMLRYRGAT